ncbi:MAG: hypothetical protein B9S32_07475 [Verrucomicrobia bacterium Tous-C9LFEB]|nr:MAG: hypothetical protein B9S32_07475 [Verrucomicrobia bacterium Tous-C9LFEB]
MNKRVFWFVFGICISLSLVQAETVIKDSFGGTGQRAAGEKLNKTATESRNAIWESTPTVLLGEDSGKGCVVVADNTGFLAKLKIPANSKVIRIEADAHPMPSGDADRTGFVMIGMGKPPGFNINWVGGIYLSLDVKGRAAVQYHPELNDGVDANKGLGVKGMKSAIIKSFKADGMNKMVIEYDSSAGTVSAWVNDEEVVNRFALEKTGFTPVLETLGFSGWALQSNVPLLADFTVTLK